MKKFFSFLCALTIVLSASAAPLKSVKAANQISFKKSLNVEALAASGLAKQAKALKAAQATIGIEVSNVTFNSAHIAFTPSDAEAYYVFNLAPAAEVEEYTDAELAVELIELYKEAIIAELGEEYLPYLPYFFFYDGDFEDDFDELTANTEYVAFAFYVDGEGNLQGNVSKKSFTTLGVTPSKQEDLTLTGGEFYIYDFGAWQFWGESEKAVISIAAYTEDVAGHYKGSDLAASYSYVGKVAGADTTWYVLADADFELAVAGANVTINGTFVGVNEDNEEDAIEFTLNLAGVIDGEEQDIENIELTKEAKKVVVDGKVFIIRDEKLFDLRGAQVR